MNAEPTKQSLADAYPHLAVQWHPTKNEGREFESLTPGSNFRAWWRCEMDDRHEWQTSIYNRVKSGSGCPFCAGVRALAGVNDLSVTHPELYAQIDFDLTDPKNYVVSASSDRAVWWKCPEGHSWKAAVKHRTQGRGCAVCAGKKVVAGYNDALTTHPHLAKVWDFEKNPEPLALFTGGSNKRAWWKCERGHEWEAPIAKVARAKGSGCPYCSGKKTWAGFNDLPTFYPEVASEFHQTKNGSLLAADLTVSSGRKVWWQCQSGHEWQAAVSHRTGASGGVPTGCPTCSNRIVIPGHNDFAEAYPAMAQEWHPTKNGDLTPDAVSPASGKLVWWQCAEGHEWQTWVYARAFGNSCAICTGAGSSKGEQEVASVLRDLGYVVEERSRDRVPGVEIDIYLPDHGLGIEFNGVYWHSEAGGKSKYYHSKKYEACAREGVQLYQVWEDDWRNRKSVVIRGILHRLGASSRLAEVLPDEHAHLSERVGARTCSLVELDAITAAHFMEANHIQGHASGSRYFGLSDRENNLRAVLTVKVPRSGGDAYIVRYATAGIIPGGFTRLLTHAEKELVGLVRRWVTFADRSVSDGDLYSAHGFTVDRILPPDYSYLVSGRRVHKFNYRLKRFREDPNLIWKEGLTERELAQLNGLHRIWDSGKVRYVKDV